MAQSGRPLVRKAHERGKVYLLPDGKTVRVRTNNDRCLITHSDLPEADGRLDIEGTNFLLIVMPKEKRKAGDVFAYFVRTADAVRAVRRAHKTWTEGPNNTRGDNRTPAIWFDCTSVGPSSDFAEKWKKYRLEVLEHPD
jgi:hypothetical protein